MRRRGVVPVGERNKKLMHFVLYVRLYFVFFYFFLFSVEGAEQSLWLVSEGAPGCVILQCAGLGESAFYGGSGSEVRTAR